MYYLLLKYNHYLFTEYWLKFNDASLLHAELNTKINIWLNIQGHALCVIKLY